METTTLTDDDNISYVDDPCQQNSTDERSCHTIMDTLPVQLILYGINAGAILLLLFLTPRTNYLCRMKGHCGLLTPIPFLERFTDRRMVVAVFTISTLSVYEFLFGEFLFLEDEVPLMAHVFLRLAFVVIICLQFLPMLTCIARGDLFGNIIGALYTSTFITLRLLKATTLCEYGHHTESEIVYMTVTYAISLPTGLYLTSRFLYRIFFQTAASWALKEEKAAFSQVKYIQRLLSGKRDTVEDKPELFTTEWIWSKIPYSKIKGFQYSSTILVSVSAGMVSVSMLMALNVTTAHAALKKVRKFLACIRTDLDFQIPDISQEIAKIIVKKKLGTLPSKLDGLATVQVMDYIDTQVNLFFGSVFTAMGLAYIIALFTSLHMLKSYQGNILELYRQKENAKLLDINKMDNVKLTVSAIRFGGYQVAHMIWGNLLQTLVLFIISLLVGEILVLVFIQKMWAILLLAVNFLGPLLLVMILIRLIQYCLVKWFFLQENGKVLALDNRKGFYSMMFFMFFYNTLRGMFSCSLRITKSIFFGLWFFPRLDHTIFPRTFESYDSGFKAYVCLLKLEAVQNNIIVCSFIRTLYQAAKCDTTDNYLINSLYEENSISSETSIYTLRKRRARIRWYIAWTLLHNIQLRRERKSPIRRIVNTSQLRRRRVKSVA